MFSDTASGSGHINSLLWEKRDPVATRKGSEMETVRFPDLARYMVVGRASRKIYQRDESPGPVQMKA